MAKCSKCNNEIEDNAKFCEHCGADVTNEEYTPKQRYDFSKAKVIGIVVAILAAIGIVGFVVLKITGGSAVDAKGYVKNWNSRVEVQKEDLSSVYKDTIVEDMLKEIDIDDADENDNKYEFELYEAYNDDKAVLTIKTEDVGIVNEVSVLMEEGVFETFVNEFYSEEDAIDGFELIHTVALSSMFNNKAAYRDAAEIIDDVWDDFFEDQSEYYDEYKDAWILNETYDNIEITLELEEGINYNYMTFTAKRV